jgi:hypothetical protein
MDFPAHEDPRFLAMWNVTDAAEFPDRRDAARRIG